jgi:small subunit ribosomal protein S20
VFRGDIFSPTNRGFSNVATRHKSAVKANKQTIKRTEHNRELRSKLRTGLKSIRAAIDSGDTAAAKAALSQTFSLIDKMSAKKIIHDNAAGRYKSRIAKNLAKKTATA